MSYNRNNRNRNYNNRKPQPPPVAKPKPVLDPVADHAGNNWNTKWETLDLVEFYKTLDPYVRSAWYSDKGWEKHLAKLPPKPSPKPSPRKDDRKEAKKEERKDERREDKRPSTSAWSDVLKKKDAPFNQSPAPRVVMKTRFCRNVLDNRRCRKECSFAHSLGEFEPVRCMYENRCRRAVCVFIHPRETKTAFLDRLRR
jgi:hypothetical protein